MNDKIKATILIITVFITSVLTSIIFLSFKYKNTCKVNIDFSKSEMISVLTIKDNKDTEKTKSSLKEGETISIKIDSNSDTKNLVWTSEDDSIASVDKTGTVTAQKAGKTKIIAKSLDAKVAEVELEVKKSITIIYHRNLNDNDAIELKQLVVEDENSKYGTINNKEYDFSSWNKDKKLLGWSTKKDSRTEDFDINEEIEDKWLNKVYDKKIDEQKESKVIDLYAIWAEDIDLVLFIGQSNMVGYTGMYKYEQESKDKRDISKYIDKDIIDEYKTFSYVSVQVPKGVAFDYKIGKNNKGTLEEITSNTKVLGEKSTYINGSLKYYDSSYKYYSLLASYGTNMIPQFAKTYYEETGNKMVSVMAANGGEPIANFLPSTDAEYNDKQYIYEATKEKYLSTVDYLEHNGYRVVNRFYIMYQGCSDATEELSKENKYYNTYMKVHNYLKKDLGLTFGAIVETSMEISKKKEKDEYVEKIHNEQEKLINNNSDIILGSDLGYVAYKNEYKEIFALEELKDGDKIINNSVHLTAASLSQVGKTSAQNVAKYMKNK